MMTEKGARDFFLASGMEDSDCGECQGRKRYEVQSYSKTESGKQR